MSARLLFCICLLLSGVAWIGPTSAYKVATGGRDVTANIVAEGNAYTAPVVSACSGQIPTPCTITIYNNSTATQTYTVTMQLDAKAAVTTWNIDNTLPSGNVATGNAVAIGGTSTVTISARSCTLPCFTRTVTWMIQGANGAILTSREENVVLTVVNAN